MLRAGGGRGGGVEGGLRLADSVNEGGDAALVLQPQVNKCRVASVRHVARDPCQSTCWLLADLHRPAYLQPVEGGAEDLEVLPRVATRAHDGLPLLPASIGDRG